MTDDITLREAHRDDLEFLFHVLKTSLGPYIVETYGPWQEEERRARFFELTNPEAHHIVTGQTDTHLPIERAPHPRIGVGRQATDSP